MNAYELADELETSVNTGLRFTAATMLRQQQAEIEALKKDLDNSNALIKLFTPIVARHSKSMQEQVNYLETQVYGGTTK